MIKVWLSGAGLLVVSGEQALDKSCLVSDAVNLLSDEISIRDPPGNTFTCFSRVVLFCGLPGKTIEGLIEIWDEDLSTYLVAMQWFVISNFLSSMKN